MKTIVLTTFLLLTKGLFAQEFDANYLNPKTITHGNCNVYLVLDDNMQDLSSKILNKLKNKFNSVKFVTLDDEIAVGDLQIVSTLSAGRDPYVPAVFACHASIELVSYSNWDLISKVHYDKKSIFFNMKKCEHKVLNALDMLPNCIKNL